jgi:hypothetical protein
MYIYFNVLRDEENKIISGEFTFIRTPLSKEGGTALDADAIVTGNDNQPRVYTFKAKL